MQDRPILGTTKEEPDIKATELRRQIDREMTIWHGPKGPDGRRVKIEISNSKDLPAFGGYLTGTAKKNKAKVHLNLWLMAEALKNGTTPEDPPTPGDFRRFFSETLTHELLHVCEEVYDLAFNEADVILALARATGEGVDSCTDEEMIALLQQEIAELENQLAEKSSIGHAGWAILGLAFVGLVCMIGAAVNLFL